MEIKQAIQSSANVIRVTSVSPGDVYKRFDEAYADRVYFGIIKNVHNDGDNTIIESIEYRYSYGSMDVEYKVLRGTNNYILFPASPEELDMELSGCISRKKREIEEYEEKINKDKKIIIEIEDLISGKTQKNLKTMSYVELSQKSYEEKMKLIG
jgi:hypothetical protein